LIADIVIDGIDVSIASWAAASAIDTITPLLIH
jgi:hypothetical protein